MYYILNFFPFVIQTLICLDYIKNNTVFQNWLQVLYVVALLAGFPLYMILINAVFLKSGRISYRKSIFCMTGVTILNTAWFLVAHRIKFGTFIGDVPGGIYGAIIVIPVIIILIGLAIVYYHYNREHM